MFNFIDSIIKTAVAVLTGALITVGGIFSHKQAEIMPVQTLPTQVPQQIQIPEIEQSAKSSSSKQEASSTETKVIKNGKTENKITKKENKNPAVPVIPEIPVLLKKAADIISENLIVPAIVPKDDSLPLSLPPERQIDPQTIVGILCYFNTVLNNPLNGASVTDDWILVRGSGVIINSQGYILTNKHIVVQPDSKAIINLPDGGQREINISYQLEHCEAGTVPVGSHLPTPDEIIKINPLIRVPILQYTAQPVYFSPNSGLSDREQILADFAVLQITGLSHDAPTFGFNFVPSSFPYSKVIPVQKYNLLGNRVITYGFPGDVTAGQRDSFQVLTMTGSVGSLTKLGFGEKFYADVPLVIYTNLEISHGRSGSPLFWRGYVIGLTTFFVGDNRTESGSVASDAIVKTLQSTGYLGQ